MFSSNKTNVVFLASLLLALPAHAQEMDMHHDHAAMQHSAHAAQHTMVGALGDYSMNREASGTSWVPESSPMPGIMGHQGAWQTMVQGYADVVYNDQGGPRGDEQIYSQSMLMGMAQRRVGEGTFGVRAMGSLDALMGKSGYPLLLQTGETANGVDPLTDRQHPHDLLMELAATYSHPTGAGQSAFLYVGYPGEPALGPATFMHRASGMWNPLAPITHHWLDSTHITFGVLTAGYIMNDWKLEASSFTGREPDQYRWNFDTPKFDSQSLRLSYNPTPNWSLQVSHGWLNSPEQLEPEIDQQRTTASAIYNLPLERGNWQTTLAWGRNELDPGEVYNAFILESTYRFRDRHSLFGRVERAEKEHLFDHSSPLHDRAFMVNQFSAGYLYDIPLNDTVKMSVGGVGTVYALPSALDASYGDHPASFLLFSRFSLYQ